jgi:hypothetical protein
MVLSIVSGVRQEFGEGLKRKCPVHRPVKLDVVGLGALVGQAEKVEVAAGVADDGKLGKVGFLESGALAVILTGVTVFVPGGVDGRLFASFCDKAETAGELQSGLKELYEPPFFRSLASA